MLVGVPLFVIKMVDRGENRDLGVGNNACLKGWVGVGNKGGRTKTEGAEVGGGSENFAKSDGEGGGTGLGESSDVTDGKPESLNDFSGTAMQSINEKTSSNSFSFSPPIPKSISSIHSSPDSDSDTLFPFTPFLSCFQSRRLRFLTASGSTSVTVTDGRTDASSSSATGESEGFSTDNDSSTSRGTDGPSDA